MIPVQDVEVLEQGDKVVVTMMRENYSVVRSLIAETVFIGDPRDFQTRIGVTLEEARELLDQFPDIWS